MNLTINSPNDIRNEADESLGNVLDALVNHKLNPSDVQRALEAFIDQKDAAHAAALSENDTELEALKAKLAEHQQESEALVAAAEDAIGREAYEELGPIVAQAKLFGEAREKAKITLEAAELERKLAELRSKL